MKLVLGILVVAMGVAMMAYTPIAGGFQVLMGAFLTWRGVVDEIQKAKKKS